MLGLILEDGVGGAGHLLPFFYAGFFIGASGEGIPVNVANG